jgi:hypothetical protein
VVWLVILLLLWLPWPSSAAARRFPGSGRSTGGSRRGERVADPSTGSLRLRTVHADDRRVSTGEKVCDCCGKPLDDDPVVVIVHADGAELVRHRECQMLELLERA